MGYNKNKPIVTVEPEVKKEEKKEEKKAVSTKTAAAKENGNPTGNQIEQHLYAKTLFIGANDNIFNYVEVYKPVEE